MKKNHLLPVLIGIFVISCIPFLCVLLTGKSFFARDLTYLFQPWRVYAAEHMQKGALPLWNPHAYCGMPFMANMQTAVWYPFTIVFYIFPFVAGLKIFHLVHYGLAAVFMFLFSRRMHISVVGSITLAALFSQNGYLMTKIEFLSLLGSAIWLPLIWLSSGNWLLLSFAFALSFLSGYPQIVFMQAAALVLLFIMFRKINVKTSGCILIAGLGAVLLSAIQFLPSFQLFWESSRGISGIPADVAGEYSLSLKHFVGIVMPFLAGRNYGQITGEKIFWMHGMHIGIVGGLVFLSGIMSMPRRLKAVCMTSLILVMVIALGKNTFLFSVMYRYALIYKFFRYPSSILYLFIAIIMLVMISSSWLSKKIALPLCLLIITELCILNRGLYPVAPSQIFHQKNRTASYIQKHGDAVRYIVSPLTQQNVCNVRAEGLIQLWQKAKERLLGQTGVPYHINNADGIGEPMVMHRQQQMIEKIFSSKNIDDAFKNGTSAGIQYVILSYPTEKTYKSVNLENGVFIAENNYSKPFGRPRILYYPGWRGYRDGRRIILNVDKDGWIDTESDTGSLHIRYRSSFLLAGLTITLASVCMAAGVLVRKYCFL